MNLLQRAAVMFQRSIPAAAGMSIADLDRVMGWALYGQPTYTGKVVSQASALAVSAVWSCVDVLSGDIATAPLLPYRRTGAMLSSGKYQRELATDHYLYPLLTHAANSEMPAWRWKNLSQAHLCLWGNAYSEIEISGRGQVVGLWPWRPDRVRMKREVAGGPIIYSYRMADGQTLRVPQDRMLHLRGLGIDGLTGLSPIEVHRQGIGLAQAMQEHAARFYANGARPLGVLRHPQKLKKEGGVEEVREAWQAVHGGLTNAHRVAILQEGMDYKEIGLDMVNAQYLESQKFSVTDIARIFRVPPHRIADLQESTNNNIEHQGLEYVQYGLGPWGANWANEIAHSLLSPREADEIFLEFDFKHLLKGDLVAQSQFITAATQWGTLTPDELREELFGMNPHPNGLGKIPWRPANINLANAEAAPLPSKPDIPPMPPGDKSSPKQKVNGAAH